MWATATHRLGALIVGIALVYATVAQGAFAADQAAVVYRARRGRGGGGAGGAACRAPAVVVAVGLLVALAVWTAARAAA